MARRLSLVLSREQVRVIHDAALEHARESSDNTIKLRWEAVIRAAKKALDFDVQTRADAPKVR